MTEQTSEEPIDYPKTYFYFFHPDNLGFIRSRNGYQKFNLWKSPPIGKPK